MMAAAAAAASTNEPLFERIAARKWTQIGDQEDLAPYLPYLLRYALETTPNSKLILDKVLKYKDANILLKYFAVNISALSRVVEQDLAKPAVVEGGLSKITDMSAKLVSFENDDEEQRLRHIAFELLLCAESLREGRSIESELLSNPLYFRELSLGIPVLLLRSTLVPLREAVRVLLHLDSSANALILGLVRSQPATLLTVIGHVIEFATSVELAEKAKNILLRLCEMAPSSCAVYIRNRLLTDQQTMPSLPFLICAKYCNDEVEFCNAILLLNFAWMREYIKRAQDEPNSPLKLLREKLLSQTLSCHSAPEDRSRVAAALLRAYTGMSSLMGMRLMQAEVEACLDLLTPTQNLRVLRLGLCFVLSCSGLGKLVSRKTLLAALTAMQQSGKLPELLLLMAVYYHTAQHTAIADLVRSTLGVKILLQIESLTFVSSLFTEELFTEAVVAKEALTLPITKKLSANSASAVSIACMHHLLKNALLSKHRVDAASWVLSQVLECDTPIHPLMPAMLVELANCALAAAPNFRMTLWSEWNLRSAFQNPKTGRAARVLLLFFVLTVNTTLLRPSAAAGVNNPMKNLKPYSKDLLDSVNVQQIMRETEFHQHDLYANIYPMLLSLVVSHFPQLYNVPTILQAIENRTNSVHRMSAAATLDLATHFDEATQLEVPITSELTPDSMRTLLEELPKSHAAVVVALNRIYALSDDRLKLYSAVLLSTIPKRVLDQTASYHIAVIYKTIWERMNGLLCWEQALDTVTALRLQEPIMQPYRHADLIADPLLVLKCDRRVFRCPPLFSLLLQTLSVYMAAFRKHVYNRHIQSNAKPEEHSALVFAQDSCIAQVLLEVCLLDSERDNLGELEEIRGLVCAFLHQMFIESPLLIKLVHFQGYDASLLPVTVQGVGSMHLCLDFIPELLAQPQAEKQLFAIRLASYIIEKYPLPKSLALARGIIAFLHAAKQTPEPVPLLYQSICCVSSSRP